MELGQSSRVSKFGTIDKINKNYVIDKLSDFFDRKVFHDYLSQFKEERDLEDIDGIMSTERIVNSFKNYFKRAEIDLKEVAEMQDEFELEYAMSKIFSKKQKS